MGNSLELHRGGQLDTKFCDASLQCSEDSGWTTEMLRDCCKRHREIMPPGSFRLTKEDFNELFSFLQPPADRRQLKISGAKHSPPDPDPDPDLDPASASASASSPSSSSASTSSASKSHTTIHRSASLPVLKKEKHGRESKVKSRAKSKGLHRGPSSPTRIAKNTTTTNANNNANANANNNANNNKSRKDKVTIRTNKKQSPKTKHRKSLFFLPDPRDIMFDALRQRSTGIHKPKSQVHHEASFFVAVAALGLCARSTMENRLHFLFDLFHPQSGYGGVVTPTDMESGSKLLSIRELSFLTFTTLRALSGIMHGYLDHVNVDRHNVKHSIVTLVKNMELSERDFDHHDGFSWLDFEKLIHAWVLPEAPWLYGVLDDAIYLDQDDLVPETGSGRSGEKSKGSRGKNTDPYRRRRRRESPTKKKEAADSVDQNQKKEHGKRATKFRKSSKGMIEVSVISLASTSGGGHTHADRASVDSHKSMSHSSGGTAFTAHLRPMLHRTIQKMAKKTKPKSLDGAGIVSWNSKVMFTDTGEGTEAAERSWSYGLDLELRVGSTVCGGCFINMFTLLDSGQFGMQVPVRSARKRDKISWGGGIIGKIRISANHISREKIEMLEKQRADKKQKEEEERKRREQEEEENEEW